jgi:hypothetical protein
MGTVEQSDGDTALDAQVEELATNVASFTREQTLNAELQKLRVQIAKLGKVYESALDDAIPKLIEMRDLISQRGAKRVKGANPEFRTWTEYLKDFAHAVGYDIRQIQRKIKEYEEGHGLVQDYCPSIPLRLGARIPKLEKKKILDEVGRVVTQMMQASSQGEPIDEYFSQLCSLGIINDSDLQSAGQSVADAPAPVRPEQFVPKSDYRRPSPEVFKPGNWLLLLEALDIEMGEGIRRTFEVAPGEATVIGKQFFEEFAWTFFPVDGARSESREASWKSTASLRAPHDSIFCGPIS